MRKVQTREGIKRAAYLVTTSPTSQHQLTRVSGLFGWLKKTQTHLRFDLGNLYTRVALGQNLIYIQPTCFLWDNQAHEVLTIGKQAFKLLGKEPQGTQLIFPIQFGAIVDLDYFNHYLKALLTVLRQEKYLHWSSLLSADIFVPTASTALDKKLLVRGFALQGIGRVKINSKAQMLVAGLSSLTHLSSQATSSITLLSEPSNTSAGAALVVILDIGEQLTEVVIGSFNRVAFSASLDFGSGLLSSAILDYLRKKHELIIARSQAMSLKKELASLQIFFDSSITGQAGKTSSPLMAVRGVSAQTGLVTTLNIQSQAIAQVIMTQLSELVTKLRQTLAGVPSAQLLSALENGLIITGGGSQLAGLDHYLAQELQINVFKADQPFACL